MTDIEKWHRLCSYVLVRLSDADRFQEAPEATTEEFSAPLDRLMAEVFGNPDWKLSDEA